LWYYLCCRCVPRPKGYGTHKAGDEKDKVIGDGTGKEREMEMFSLARKFLLLGVGALSLTEERLEQLINSMISKGEISTEQGRELFKEMLEKVSREKEQLLENMRNEFDRMMEKADLPRRSDFVALEKRLTALEQAVREQHPSGS
jgi:polyhydroxyalkanoate synthesis regulator phasin